MNQHTNEAFKIDPAQLTADSIPGILFGSGGLVLGLKLEQNEIVDSALGIVAQNGGVIDQHTVNGEITMTGFDVVIPIAAKHMPTKTSALLVAELPADLEIKLGAIAGAAKVQLVDPIIETGAGLGSNFYPGTGSGQIELATNKRYVVLTVKGGEQRNIMALTQFENVTAIAVDQDKGLALLAGTHKPTQKQMLKVVDIQRWTIVAQVNLDQTPASDAAFVDGTPLIVMGDTELTLKCVDESRQLRPTGFKGYNRITVQAGTPIATHHSDGAAYQLNLADTEAYLLQAAPEPGMFFRGLTTNADGAIENAVFVGNDGWTNVQAEEPLKQVIGLSAGL